MRTTSSPLAWASDELAKITGADDLKISPFRADGVTYGTPTWIWSVALNGELYVRAYHGQQSRWHQSAVTQKAGRIHVIGLTKDVQFEPVEGEINEAIDEAYRVKYKGSSYLGAMISNRAKAATVRIVLSSKV